jgi:hypothetical protein
MNQIEDTRKRGEDFGIAGGVGVVGAQPQPVLLLLQRL